MSVLWGFTEGLDSLFDASSIGSDADATTGELVPTVLQTVSNTRIPEVGSQTDTIGPTTEIQHYHETFQCMPYVAVVGATASDTTRGTATSQGSTSIGTTGSVRVASSTSAGGQARITPPPKWIQCAL
ncbi:hypothetical protein BP5796_08286 [Coleophoma crateriformis]|uniref:Uncharacterized protein n=1 Tax=Coleophoma crateriformis TaxID=565419 RepID=A0A3D8R769_9HELO|nr:hypothetical protein BP5796_08286 [Coleophoma crateriformis]